MGRRALFLLVLIALAALAAPPARAQGPISATATAELLPELPRRLRFAVEASSSAGNLSEARLFFRPTGSTTRISEAIAFEAAPTASLSHEWDMQRNGTPPGSEIEYFWRLTDSAGNSFETPPATLVALDPRFAWQTQEDEELAIHWYAGDGAWGQEMFTTGKQALAQLEEALGTQIERQVRLVAYGSGDDFRGAFPVQQDWIGGQAFPALGVTVQIIGAGERDWMRTVLFHELSHLVFSQALEGSLARAPSWLDEGLAMVNEPDDDTSASRDSATLVRNAAQDGDLLPFSQLQGNFGADGQTVGIAYAQSEMIVTYLMDDCGADGFRALIANMVDDMAVDAALEAACGYNSQTLFSQWRQTLPNAPDDAPSAPGDAAPAPASDGGVPGWVLATIVGGLCFVAVLAFAILAIVIRLLRPSGNVT